MLSMGAVPKQFSLARDITHFREIRFNIIIPLSEVSSPTPPQPSFEQPIVAISFSFSSAYIIKPTYKL